MTILNVKFDNGELNRSQLEQLVEDIMMVLNDNKKIPANFLSSINHLQMFIDKLKELNPRYSSCDQIHLRNWTRHALSELDQINYSIEKKGKVKVKILGPND